MLITVIRAGKGIFHFTGDVDAYNLEMLREQLTEAAGTRLRITLEPAEEAAFRERSSQWLTTLARNGVSVSLHRALPRPVSQRWPTAAAAEPESRATEADRSPAEAGLRSL